MAGYSCRSESPGLGWTINLGHPRAKHSLVFLGIIIWLLPALIAGVRHRSMLASDATPWWWLAGSLALTSAAVFLNPLCRYRAAHVPIAMTFGVSAAVAGFTIQAILNGPVVAMLGEDKLTWRSHLYLAMVAAGAQTVSKAIFIPLGWRFLRVGDMTGKMQLALLVGLGFAAHEALVVWSQSVSSGAERDGWQLGVLERGIAAMFHVYSSGLLAIGVIRQNFLPFVLVIGVHFLTDWAAGANATLLQLSTAQLELSFLVPVVALWIGFLMRCPVVIHDNESRQKG